MKDRLTQLLLNLPDREVEIDGVKVGKRLHTAESVAEYLISEGVIVLPCKVGDTVYRPIITSKGEPAIWEIIVTTISINIDKNGVSSNSYVIGHLKRTHCGESADFHEFGKTVFLTREEAEQALKGANDEQR